MNEDFCRKSYESFVNKAMGYLDDFLLKVQGVRF